MSPGCCFVLVFQSPSSIFPSLFDVHKRKEDGRNQARVDTFIGFFHFAPHDKEIQSSTIIIKPLQFCYLPSQQKM
jgi:hypothetical protein